MRYPSFEKSHAESSPGSYCGSSDHNRKYALLETLSLSQAVALGGLAVAPELFEMAEVLFPLAGLAYCYLVGSSIVELIDRRDQGKQDAVQTCRDLCVFVAPVTFLFVAAAPISLMVVIGGRAFFDAINFIRYGAEAWVGPPKDQKDEAAREQYRQMVREHRPIMVKSGLSATQNILIFLALLALTGHPVGMSLVVILALAAIVTALVTAYRIRYALKKEFNHSGTNSEVKKPNPQALTNSSSDNSELDAPNTAALNNSGVNSELNNSHRKTPALNNNTDKTNTDKTGLQRPSIFASSTNRRSNNYNPSDVGDCLCFCVGCCCDSNVDCNFTC